MTGRQPDVVQEKIAGPRLWLADRGFCGPKLFAWLSTTQDHFVVRHAQRTPFTPDPKKPPRPGRDRAGRRYVERWGWLGRPTHPQRCYVRFITLHRPGEEDLTLVTDLTDARRYPASDLLELYRLRWGIERMFQQVTEVFGLDTLIGSSPEATVFQFAFCLLLYNVIQVVRASVAAAQRRSCESISTEKLFVDVQRELIAWSVLVPPKATLAHLAAFSGLHRIRTHLKGLLKTCWTARWIKSPPAQRRAGPAPPRNRRSHGSVYRILQAHHQKRTKKRRAP